MAQDGSTFHTHRNNTLPYYPKEPDVFPYLRQIILPPHSL